MKWDIKNLILIVFSQLSAFTIKLTNRQTKRVSGYGKHQVIHKQLKAHPPRARQYQKNDRSFRKQAL